MSLFKKKPETTKKDYKLTLLFNPELENNLNPTLEKVKKIIADNGGEITNEENDGKKRLAYMINNNEYAIYYYIELLLPDGAPAKISSKFDLTNEILHYLLIRAQVRGQHGA